MAPPVVAGAALSPSSVLLVLMPTPSLMLLRKESGSAASDRLARRQVCRISAHRNDALTTAAGRGLGRGILDTFEMGGGE
jgi:hypothetical protein